ncbi:MAG: hypothetical protein EXR02_08645 [Rhodospirillales bacterium]|nr:hypothetical protein [Rhodospirillales bacterium]MSP81108.1 hypothetical protein [Rhodospirillales bacterium]
MTDDPLRYDLWIEDAFRSVVRRALAYTATRGLPGDHHFYITFRTAAPGVRVPSYLKAQHPLEMIIVLQFKFDDLAITDDGFSVTLSFKNKRENLYIPFAAVASFSDPSVSFGLQFKITADGQVHADASGDTPPPKSAAPRNDVAAKAEPQAAKPAPEASGQVVTLDSFRKK